MMNRFGWSNSGSRRREGVPGAFGRGGQAPERRPAPRAKSLAEIKDEKFGALAGLLAEATEAHRKIRDAAGDHAKAEAERERDQNVERAAAVIKAATLYVGDNGVREQAFLLQYLGDLIVAGDLPLGSLMSLGNAMKNIAKPAGGEDPYARLRWEPVRRYRSLGLLLAVLGELEEHEYRVERDRGVKNAVIAAREALESAAEQAATGNRFAEKKAIRARISELESAFAPFFRKEEERVAVEHDGRSNNPVIESPNGGQKTEPASASAAE